MANLDSTLKIRDIILLTKVLIVKDMFFPVAMYRCESWTLKKPEHQRIDAFKIWCWRTLESPLDSKEIKPNNPKGNQPWIFIGRTIVETEVPILWPHVEKSQLIGKTPWCWERSWLDSIMTQWTGDWANSKRRWRTGKPGMYSPQDRGESDTTWQLNNNKKPRNPMG